MAALRTVIVAFGTTAPLTSLTEPKIVPDVTCADTLVSMTLIITAIGANKRTRD
jgi:hypothetical protein